MEKDIDNKLYDEYLDGEESAFEFLYNKYKGRVLYFIYNIRLSKVRGFSTRNIYLYNEKSKERKYII